MIGIFTLLIDRTLAERYRLDKLLGTGGMGAIYRAHDLKLQREVAVKVMTATAADPHDQRTLRERFHREARSAARLKHPNVVTVHDFGTDAATGIDFIVMEMLHGEDLAVRLRRVSSLPVPEAIHIAQQAALGLGAGHQAGMVHRDVKPANLFLLAGSYAPQVKLLDFGIAQFISDVETRLTMAGTPQTPRYASPEQLLGSAELTPASDVFSLGMTLLEALAGEYPEGVNSGRRDPVEIIAAGQGVFGGHVSRQLLAALEGALDLDPTTRIANANAFLVVLNGERSSSHDNASKLYSHSGSGTAESTGENGSDAAAVSGATAPKPDALSDDSHTTPASSGTAAAGFVRVGSSSDSIALSQAETRASADSRTHGQVASPAGQPRAAIPNTSPATRTPAASSLVRRPAALGVALVLIIGSGAIWYASRSSVNKNSTAAPASSSEQTASGFSPSETTVPDAPAPIPEISDSMRNGYFSQLAGDTAGAGAAEGQPVNRFPVGANPAFAVSKGWPVVGEVPRAGALLPYHRIVAYYGNPFSANMGVLGAYTHDEMMRRLDRTVDAWNQADRQTPVIPALHLIAAVAQGEPGPEGKYRSVMPDTLIEKVYGWIRQRNGLLFLDIHPGLSTVREMLPRFEQFLTRRDVHLALDPEFAMRGGVRPGTRIGTLTAADVNWVITELDRIVRENGLPPKVLVVHRFTRNMLPDAEDVRPTPNVQVVINMSGWGTAELKRDAYRDYVVGHPVQYTGFKVFYRNDTRNGEPLLSPADLLRLRPVPRYIVYQ